MLICDNNGRATFSTYTQNENKPFRVIWTCKGNSGPVCACLGWRLFAVLGRGRRKEVCLKDERQAKDTEGRAIGSCSISYWWARNCVLRVMHPREAAHHRPCSWQPSLLRTCSKHLWTLQIKPRKWKHRCSKNYVFIFLYASLKKGTVLLVVH